MRIVQQVDVFAEFVPEPLEQSRHEVQVAFAAPAVLRRQMFLRRLVEQLAASDAVGGRKAGHSRLRADGAITKPCVLRDGFHRRVDVGAVRMPVHQHCFTRWPAE